MFIYKYIVITLSLNYQPSGLIQITPKTPKLEKPSYCNPPQRSDPNTQPKITNLPMKPLKSRRTWELHSGICFPFPCNGLQSSSSVSWVSRLPWGVIPGPSLSMALRSTTKYATANNSVRYSKIKVDETCRILSPAKPHLPISRDR